MLLDLIHSLNLLTNQSKSLDQVWLSISATLYYKTNHNTTTSLSHTPEKPIKCSILSASNIKETKKKGIELNSRESHENKHYYNYNHISHSHLLLVSSDHANPKIHVPLSLHIRFPIRHCLHIQPP